MAADNDETLVSFALSSLALACCLGLFFAGFWFLVNFVAGTWDKAAYWGLAATAQAWYVIWWARHPEAG